MKKAIVLMLVIALFSAMIVSAADYTLSSSSGIWTATDGGSSITGLNSNEVRWGTPADFGGSKSGLRFDGTGVQAFNEGDTFLIGELTHLNWPIYSGGAPDGATMQVTLVFSSPTVNPNPVFTFDFDVLETPNEDDVDECDDDIQQSGTPCDDRITFPTSYGEESFTINDKLYTLKISGFVDTYPGGTPVDELITEEKANSGAYLVGTLSSVLIEAPQLSMVSKKTNGVIAETAPGPSIYVGESITWEYIVQNTGNVELTNIAVVDDQGVIVTCPKTTLASGESMTCTGAGIAEQGQYENGATASGKRGGNTYYTEEKLGHYYGTYCGDGIVNGPEQCDSTDICCDQSTCTFKPSNIVCNAAAGVCDLAETCTGSSATCPADAKSTGLCREDAGECDIAEYCNGVDNTCPADAFEPEFTPCSNGLFCDGAESCDASGHCLDRADPDCADDLFCTVNEGCDEDNDKCTSDPKDCSGNNIGSIETCNNNPDDNSMTWDFRNAFNSVCDETNNICTSGDQTITHTCDVDECNAECELGNTINNEFCPQTTTGCQDNKQGTRDGFGECNLNCLCAPDSFENFQCVKDACGATCDSNDDCPATTCETDKCVGKNYYDYTDAANTCKDDCSCTANACDLPVITPNDPRCTDCQTDEDCNARDKTYCDGTVIKQDNGKCVDYECATETTPVVDCDDNSWCNGDETCAEPVGITVIGPTCVAGTIRTCADDLYCTENEICDENEDKCVFTPKDCSSNDIDGVNTCTYNPDNNPFTHDDREAFLSTCDEEKNTCTTGNEDIAHECDKDNCGAECELGDTDSCEAAGGYSGIKACTSACEWGECRTDEYCGDGIINDDEECDGTAGVGPNQECNSECKLIDLSYCGDGIKNGVEECDGTDGVPSGYKCTSECELKKICPEPVCGNGELEKGEECDDGRSNGIPCDPGSGVCMYCSNKCETVVLNGGGGGGEEPVPEFSLLTLGITIIGVGLGLVFLRKRQ